MAYVSAEELRAALWTGNAAAKVTVSSATAASSQLQPGVYYATATTNLWFKQGASSITATTSANYLGSGSTVVIKVTDATANGYVAAIRDSADGYLVIMKPVDQ